MKLAAFNAFCPYEIGDKIKTQHTATIDGTPAITVERVHTITDIVCEHSVKNGTVSFLYELDNSGKLVHIVGKKV